MKYSDSMNDSALKSIPEVVSSEFRNNRLSAVLKVPTDLVYFSGHFPGSPVLPGVVQIQFVLQLLQTHLGKPVLPVTLSHVKFTSPVSPGDTLNVRIILKESDTATWRIEAGRHAVSRGKLRYKMDTHG